MAIVNKASRALPHVVVVVVVVVHNFCFRSFLSDLFCQAFVGGNTLSLRENMHE